MGSESVGVMRVGKTSETVVPGVKVGNSDS